MKILTLIKNMNKKQKRQKSCAATFMKQIDPKYATLLVTEVEKNGYDETLGDMIHFEDPQDVLTKLIGRQCRIDQTTMKWLLNKLVEMKKLDIEIKILRSALQLQLEEKWANDETWDGQCTFEFDALLSMITVKIRNFVDKKLATTAEIRRLREVGGVFECEKTAKQNTSIRSEKGSLSWINENIDAYHLRQKNPLTVKEVVNAIFSNDGYKREMQKRFGGDSDDDIASNMRQFFSKLTNDDLVSIDIVLR